MTGVKNKERMLKTARGKQQVTYKDKPFRIASDLSGEALTDRRTWTDVVKAWKQKNTCHPRILHSVKFSIKIKGERSTFHEKHKLKQFMTTNPSLQKILKGILYTEGERYNKHESSGKDKAQYKN
jgi:hypothetical protein